MALNISVQKFVQKLNYFNRNLLYFPEKNPKQFDQYEIVEIYHQAKVMDP
jgi:hypothetical protein